MGVVDPVLAANVRWLSRYRHPRCAGTPELAERCGGRSPRRRPCWPGRPRSGTLAVLPVLFHLMWRRVLAADLGSGRGSRQPGLARGGCPVSAPVQPARARDRGPGPVRRGGRPWSGCPGRLVRLAGRRRDADGGDAGGVGERRRFRAGRRAAARPRCRRRARWTGCRRPRSRRRCGGSGTSWRCCAACRRTRRRARFRGRSTTRGWCR